MKGILVVSNKLTFSSKRVSRSTRIANVSTILVPDKNVSTRKLNWILESRRTLKNYRKKKTYQYYGKTGHVENTCWNKSTDLEEKVKRLEGDVPTMHSTSWMADDFTFNIKNSQAFIDQTS